MEKFIIVTDSCCDLGSDLLEKYDIKYLQMLVNYGDYDLPADLSWQNQTPTDFYNNLRRGVNAKTSAVNVASYLDFFEEYLKENCDILCLTTASGLSASYDNALQAIDELKGKYTNKIVCVDTRRGSLGQGYIAYQAAKMREEGKTIEQIEKWVIDNRFCINQIGTVDDLKYLMRAGRLSRKSAFFGNLIGIKPLVTSSITGLNVAIKKVKGRKKSLQAIIDYIKENVIEPENQIIFIGHADCIEDALYLKKICLEEIGFKDSYVNYIGPVIGAVVGPGMLGLYYYGKENTIVPEN